MKRLLITGASGNLGRPLSELAASTVETISIYHQHPGVGGGSAVQLDLRDDQAVNSLIGELKPTTIIHAAASERSADMVETNRSAAQNITRAAQNIGTRLITMSTDLVFDGTAPPYDESALPTPSTLYGQVKAENELFFLTYPNCLIVRTSIIYDLNPLNNQIAWLQRLLDAKEPIPLFVDEIRQPIWAWNLATILLELADTSTTGILNVAGPRPLSRREYGCALLRAMGHTPDSITQPVYASQVAPQRPRDCTMNLTKARTLLQAPLLEMERALVLAREKNRLSGPPNLNDDKAMI